MDELPELLVETVGGETVIETVAIGGGDYVAVTPAATHLYRSEGLLSDESIETYAHDVDRFAIETGRRKSSILLERIDEESSFTIPTSVIDPVVEAMLEGVLRTAGVVADDETVEAQFRFSELTLVVTDEQLLKHVGGAVWNDDFEAFHYANLTGLDFEEGSVATQIVVEAGGRRQRVKVPNDNAGRVRQEIQRSVFRYYEVSSLDGLRAALAETDDAAATDDEPDADPSASEPSTNEPSPSEDASDGFVSADWSPPADQDITRSTKRTDETDGSDPAVTADASPAPEVVDADATAGGEAGPDPDPDPDVAELAERVDALAERVDYQTELLEAQQETIEQLVDELRRGR